MRKNIRMINNTFWDIILKYNIDLAITFPCDKIKSLITSMPNKIKSIDPTREENGVGISAGYYLAGGKPLLLIQNTGLGNSINALASLHQTYNIPLPIIVSWRGHYKENISGQIKLGENIPNILKAANIPFKIIEESVELETKLSKTIKLAFEKNTPYICLISPKVWTDNTEHKINYPTRKKSVNIQYNSKINNPKITRYDAIKEIMKNVDDQIIISNIGIPSKELFSIKDRKLNFYMLGSLGLVSSIGLGVALKSKKEVIVLDGDGSLLYNPNILINIGCIQPKNLTIICLDNGAHGSTGSQITATYNNIDLELIAKSCGIKNTIKVYDKINLNKETGPRFIHFIIKPGNSDVPKLSLEPEEIKKRFIGALNEI